MKNTKLSLTIVAAFAVVVATLLVIDRSTGAPADAAPPVTGGTGATVRQDTHTLTTAADGKVTLVEFLDFECEACLAMYPTMERIRAEYDRRITFAVRYFPIPSHPNAELAARAVEAAAAQGQFEAMYQQMYETQTSWGHQQASQEETFVGFAEELGLDVEQFRADLNDPATAERVAADQADGIEFGVQGTPTLFLNGRMLPSMPSYEELTAAIDAALAA